MLEESFERPQPQSGSKQLFISALAALPYSPNNIAYMHAMAPEKTQHLIKIPVNQVKRRMQTAHVRLHFCVKLAQLVLVNEQ